jgi:hypothetical protein
MMERHRMLGYRAEWFNHPEPAALAIIRHMRLTEYAVLPKLREPWKPEVQKRAA